MESKRILSDRSRSPSTKGPSAVFSAVANGRIKRSDCKIVATRR
jgi:hypothetical protein